MLLSTCSAKRPGEGRHERLGSAESRGASHLNAPTKLRVHHYHQTALADIRAARVAQIEPRHCDLPPSRSSRNVEQTQIQPLLGK